MPRTARSTAQGATIREVAAAARVSISTVSRALSNPDIVAPSTREHVRSVARDLGYQPTATASAAHSGTIGLVVPDLENPFFGLIAKGVQARARSAGYLVVVCDVEEDPVLERAVLDEVASGVDGLILCSPRGEESAIQEIADRVPTVIANRHISGLPAVLFDDEHGMRSTLRHLVALGHSRIAYAGGPRISWSNRRRFDVVQAFVEENDVQVVDLGSYEPYLRGGHGAADQAIAGGVTAVVAFNDLLALGILDRLAQRGVQVPEEMSVCGIDNVAASTYVRPHLTTVSSSRQRMGRTSVDLLLSALRGEAPPAPQILSAELIVRDSTGIAPATSRPPAFSGP